MVDFRFRDGGGSLNRMGHFYSDNAEALAERYERVSAADVHRAWLGLLPHAKGLVLDVGAGFVGRIS